MSLHEQETVSLTHPGTVGLSSPRELVVPKQLGSVRLIREIGRGGMGVVWSGHDDMLGRDVAVKFLMGATAAEDDPGFAAFLEGAKAAARLKCPSMTAVYHADVVEGSPYIVMEYVDGPTLARVVSKTGPLCLPAAWAVMTNVSDTVAQLHDAGIIHRDIKPSNVMLDTDSKIYLTDFGIALCRNTGETGTERVSVAGTPAYMAPEAFDGYASARTDTYALGMMFYELLTGQPAFEGTTLEEVKAQHMTKEPDKALLISRKIEPSVIELIERALRKDPKFRFKSGRHFLEAMERAQVPSGVRIRGGPELRAANLKCRSGGGGDAGHANAPESPANLTLGTPGRSLYEHMSTIAAKKRANPATPPVKAPLDSDLWGLPGSGESKRGIYAVEPKSAEDKPAAVAEPVGGRTDASQEEIRDDAPLKPATVAWIGLAVAVVFLIVFAAYVLLGGGGK